MDFKLQHDNLTSQQPELHNLKVLRCLYTLLIVVLIVMPQYFGIHLGVDFTSSRLLNILLVTYMILSPAMLTYFWKTSLRCATLYPLLLYLFVACYTMVFRVDINAFFLVFIEVLTFFTEIFGIRYVLGYKKALKLILGCAYFLTIYGFVEYLCGESLFLKFLSTVPNNVSNSYRSGHYRIMGPCGHSLGYGLLLLIFIAIACYDYEKEELNLFRRPVLLLMLLINVFLTGSRSTLGIAVLECLIIIISSKGKVFTNTLIILAFSIVGVSALLFLFQGTEAGKYILGQIMSVVDEVLDTNFAAKYGVDSTTLENSSAYRKALPYIFTLDWLNPIVGRGTSFHGAYVHGTYIHSIDNYYVIQYIKYAYPGLVSYVLFLVTVFIVLIHEVVKYKSGLAKMTLISVFCYFFNLWWVDALQTLKFIYLLLAVFFAQQLERKDKTKKMAESQKTR